MIRYHKARHSLTPAEEGRWVNLETTPMTIEDFLPYLPDDAEYQLEPKPLAQAIVGTESLSVLLKGTLRHQLTVIASGKNSTPKSVFEMPFFIPTHRPDHVFDPLLLGGEPKQG